jgi:hypothetical protein
MSKIMAMSQMDPTWIIPKKFVQEKLGINPELYEDDEEDKAYGLNPSFEQDKEGYYSGINAKREVLPNPKDKMSQAGKGKDEESSNPKAD